jgi:hypothetical protein
MRGGEKILRRPQTAKRRKEQLQMALARRQNRGEMDGFSPLSRKWRRILFPMVGENNCAALK